MQHLIGLNLTQLLKQPMPVPDFRKKQLYHWWHEKQILEYAQMHNLPDSFIEYLETEHPMPKLSVVNQQASQDGTKKLLFALGDDLVEAVIMEYHYGSSICLSTQIGCRMGCHFCASTLHGLVRNITAEEMLMMFYMAGKYAKQRLSRVVLMGSGEPLENLDQVLSFIHQVSAADGYDLSLRHIALSTCGLPQGIRALAKEALPITLALSLHAPNDELRQQIMPIAKKYSISQVMQACDEYIAVTSRRITIEYALIQDFNDTIEQAEQLSQLIKGKLYHVNLIPINPIAERAYRAPAGERLQEFKKRLEAHGIHVTIRRELGSDIVAACGQLRNQTIEQQKKAGGL